MQTWLLIFMGVWLSFIGVSFLRRKSAVDKTEHWIASKTFQDFKKRTLREIKIVLVIRVSEKDLSVHSKFIVPIESVEICCSSVARDFVGSKNQLRNLARAHAEMLWDSVETCPRDVGFYLFDKTPIEIWNGFNVMRKIKWSSPIKHVCISDGYNMPLDGDQLEFFMRELRKALH
ncbi:hypothetical protein A3I18_02785 [Candidatus Campbellbacteria bacterium RIFCSPLOWO2_02_FULL_35_11]|uniref:Uncharacterized protein n=2 Tax=Candidatus Campbelliibacteriota TaxID=1752727 RepID=A0A1F5ENZ2_9BACT|nr:MAG: hypothetical protein A3E89_00510 [Candidatus Campbellbacteria bacterium RIFCSPHIGHO2_12_FULL_35_10]OGD70406.1 MAG: hypothetical protein A3I18_02785 [Candidatus Campbellbacteria bacterium RIFCSPLOWO2_02_FULL_35_11]